MDDFRSDRVRRCIDGLTASRNPSEAIQSWLFLEAKSPELCALVSLPDYHRISIPTSLRRSMLKPANCLVPYFVSENLYFIDDEMIREMVTKEESKIGVNTIAGSGLAMQHSFFCDSSMQIKVAIIY